MPMSATEIANEIEVIGLKIYTKYYKKIRIEKCYRNC